MTLFSTSTDIQVDARIRQAAAMADIYITARPRSAAPPNVQAEALMQAVAAILHEHTAVILEERVFLSEMAMADARLARTRHLAHFDDGVEPAWLIVPATETGEISGITIHAVAGSGRPDVLTVAGHPCGRRLRQGAYTWITATNLQGEGDDAPAQARNMLTQAEAILTQANANLRDVVRTWMWLGRILAWYGDFNRVRNDRFQERGLLCTVGNIQLPASTGIGIRPTGNALCSMDLIAETGSSQPRFLLSAGRQNAASSYGSAFSRAAITQTPCGQKIHVSGTAAIDAAGNTTFVGDAAGQIADTIRCVNALLHEAGFTPHDMVQAVVYCKTQEVANLFRQQQAGLPCPYVLTIADICRENLLFELECIALR